MKVIDLVQLEREALAEEWRELCRWDPLLPPDAEPPDASHVIAQLARALSRPQPIGWGADPDVEDAAERLATRVGSVDVAVEEWVCLREALMRGIAGRIPDHELEETHERVHMVIDRAIGVTVQRAVANLQHAAFSDVLTGLANRRALDRDLERELAQARRYEHILTLVLVDLDGLKTINDQSGHPAGDACLRELADALRAGLRESDSAYRMGGDEFAVLLPETSVSRASSVIERVQAAGAPAFSWGAAGFPNDAATGRALIAAADARLIEQKQLKRRRTA